MNPNERGNQRFFSALVNVCPVQSISHLHLSNQTLSATYPIAQELVKAGFNGTLVAARSSIADAGRKFLPNCPTLLCDHPSNHEPANHILLELHPGREAAKATIEAAIDAIADNGRVWVFGSKETGIISTAKRFSDCKTQLYKGHLRLISMSKASEYQEKPGKKTTANSSRIDSEGFCQFSCHGLTISSRPGLFSWREPDPASMLLLEAMAKESLDPGPLVLDWGCGTGLLSAVLADRWPESHFILSDDQFSAVRCAQRTMEQNQLTHRAQIFAEDGVGPNLSQKKFTTILSNPPFHRGVLTDYTAINSFIEKGSQLLEKGGKFWLVGNSFLDHTALLSKHLKKVETITRGNKYTVIRGQA